jgi:hypothetical protein
VFYALKFAAFFIVISIFTGVGVVLAAEDSKPGDLLFPVKEAVKDVQIEFSFHPTPKNTSSLEAALTSETKSSESKSTSSEQDSGTEGDNNGSNSVAEQSQDPSLNQGVNEPNEIAAEPEVTVQGEAAPTPIPLSGTDQAPTASPQPVSEETKVESEEHQTSTTSKTLEFKITTKGNAVVVIKLPAGD